MIYNWWTAPFVESLSPDPASSVHVLRQIHAQSFEALWRKCEKELSSGFIYRIIQGGALPKVQKLVYKPQEPQDHFFTSRVDL